MAVRSLPPASPTAAPLWRGDVYEAIGCCKHCEEYTLALYAYGLGGYSPVKKRHAAGVNKRCSLCFF